MLYSFRVSNYRSIADTTLSLSWNGKRGRLSDTISFVEDGKKRAVPLLVIYGANSSGKSTLLSALFSYTSLVTDGVEAVSYTPDRFLSLDGTLFVMETVAGGKTYTHSITYNSEEILKESLKEDGRTLFELEKGNLISLSADTSQIVRDGRQIYSALSASPGVIPPGGCLFFNPFSFTVSDAFQRYVSLSGKKRNECLEDVVSLCRKLDLSIADIHDGEVWQTEHIGKDEEKVWLTMEEESEGTKRLFALVSLILASLSSGRVLVIDEIDVSLHSIVLRELVSLFIDSRYNTTGAQLICSSHNTDLLDAPFIHKCEIAFFEKTKKRGSVVSRLSEIEGVTSLSKFRSDYLHGRFSGVPFPYI